MFDIFNMLKKEDHKEAKQVTRDTIIGDILDMDQTTAPYFMEIGMHCLGCPASRGESIEEACAVHGVDCDELIEKLNDAPGCKEGLSAAHTGCASGGGGRAGAPRAAGGGHRLRPRQADGGAGCFGPVPQGHRGRPAPRPAVQSPADAGTCQIVKTALS